MDICDIDKKTAYNGNDCKTVNRASVLLIDDEFYLLKLWRRVLEKYGYSVTDYSESVLALEHFKKNPHSFDIVITDQSMPFINGRELAAEFFKIRSDIKIILCTGYLEDRDNRNVFMNGIKELLIKPFGNDILLKAVERNL